jgi:hypothetical protein
MIPHPTAQLWQSLTIGWGLRRRATRNEALDAPFECGSREQYFVLTCQTAHANFGTNANNPPCVTATRMRLAGLYNILKINVDW